MFYKTCGVVLLSASLLAAQEVGSTQKQAAEWMAKLMIASRQVIADNQKLFNDPTLGDKGFTPDVFAMQAADNFKKMFGADIQTDKTFPSEVGILWQAMQEVVKEAQPVLNKPGLGFKGFLPAVFARQAAAKFTAKVPGSYAKLTSVPDVHNPVNRPDAWEKQVLVKFIQSDYPKGKPYYAIVEKDGRKMLRLIQPEYFTTSCMVCHGKPKGEKGPGGVVKCGKEVGEGGAGFSIGLPLR